VFNTGGLFISGVLANGIQVSLDGVTYPLT
jgi:hypothetical protein